MVGLTHMRIRFVIIAAGALAAAGCSDAMYRKWADAQVNHIVRERESQTLNYTPQVETQTQEPAQPSARAYDKVPSTPKPPPATSPFQPSDDERAYGELGPERLFPNGVASPQSET